MTSRLEPRIEADGAPARACAFCGAKGSLTREHVLADWIGEAFGLGEPQPHWQTTEGEHARDRRYPQQPFRMKVAALCGDCNHNWSSDLETAVKPILRPMLLSRLSFRLSPTDQELLAFWAAKVLLVSQCMVPAAERVVPAAQYAEMFDKRSAPARCRVAIARRPRENASWPYRIIALGGQWRSSPPPGPRPRCEQYDTYRAVIVVGHVVFHLIGVYDSVPPGDLVAADLPPGLIEVAPSRGVTRWPPEPEVTMEEVERLMNLGSVTVARTCRRSRADAPRGG